MSEKIYLVNPDTQELTVVESCRLQDIGIKERQDLEQWVINHPDIFGEPLLVITSEFSGFDQSDRRLDVLALDESGTPVVIELKLDLSRSFADQQAIRYAAFCSTMTTADIVAEMARFHAIPQDTATDRICEFLGTEDIDLSDKQPRIVLAAGTLDDTELTSTVLWLRNFGIDIQCVELTPFRLPDGQLILHPQTIIPLPETRDYQIRIERKQQEKQKQSTSDPLVMHFYQMLKERFNETDSTYRVNAKVNGKYLTVPIRVRGMHYEWAGLKRDNIMRVAMHFEDSDRDLNLRRLAILKEHKSEIMKGSSMELHIKPWGQNWATAEYHMPVSQYDADEAQHAIELMLDLIDRTSPHLQAMADLESENGTND